jgi:hypothetical protein
VRPGNQQIPADYRAKISHEASRLSRLIVRDGNPAPLGDPASGVLLVLEQPVGPRVLEAIKLSLESLNLSDAYVTWTSTGYLLEEILTTEPTALAAVGSGAARELDGLGYPLAQRAFSEATTGRWFAWTKSTHGLLLPSISNALDDDTAKRHFWQAFRSLQELSPTEQ